MAYAGHWGFHGLQKIRDLNESLIPIVVIPADSLRLTDRRKSVVVVLLGLSSAGRSGGRVVN